MKSIFLEFSITCSNCDRPLPVNRAAENIPCPHCSSYTDTPVELWQVLVTPQMYEAIGMKPDSVSRAEGILAGVGGYRITFGQRAPQCRVCEGVWNVEDLITIGDDDASVFTCGECGTVRSLRRPPPWFEKVFPFVKILADETAPEDDKDSLKGATSISIFCYHCGSTLPLDGSSRTVRCKYCNGEFLVPDDIWARLNPVAVAHPWYVIVDLGDAEAMLPYEIDEFIDLAGLPDDDTALLWEEESEFRLGRVSGDGLLSWIARDIPCSEYARLFYVQASDTLWVLDHDEETVIAFNAATGKRIRAVENGDGDPGLISVLDHYNVTACPDNTLLVYRKWEEDASPDNITERIKRKGPHKLTAAEIAELNMKTGLREIRRFNEKGKRIPLWPGSNDTDRNPGVPSWDDMPDRPARPPEDALLETGPDGVLYMMDPASAVTARYDRGGTFLGLIRPAQKAVSEIEDFCVAGDGAIYIVFFHKKNIGGEEWSHVARIGPDGSFNLLVGPHAPKHNYSIGTWAKRISVSRRGSIHLCAYKLKDLRVLNPDGSLFRKGLWTSRYDETLAGELDEARGNK